ncbi:MAG: hypothetical protein JXA67_16620 [Micromonosporaceae bacterium]|nr:hypothetical protein [Micromonosporaceae bacterium]
MAQILRLVLPAMIGLGVASVAGAHNLDGSPGYLLTTSVLLAVGLYGSTFHIDLTEARRDRKTIGLAVTVGVLCKAVLIGGFLALAWWEPLFLVLGVAVAQIDPLAVASIMNHPTMTKRAKSILASWSSFDDPITVIVSVYAAAMVSGLTDAGTTLVAGSSSGSYLRDLATNAVFAGTAYLAWRLLRRWPKAEYALLAVLLAGAVWQFAMLGIAIVGLFLRPPIGRQLTWAVQGAVLAASFLLGLLLLDGVDLSRGLALGVVAFGAQIVVGFALTRHLPRPDQVHLAFAQQNGITAIILALVLEAQFDGVIAVVAPAILVINLIHWASNTVIDGRIRSAAPRAEVQD